MGKIRTLEQIMKNESKVRAKRLIKLILKHGKKYLKLLKQHGKTKRSKK